MSNYYQVEKHNQYGLSEIIKGTRKQVLQKLRMQASEKRMSSRKVHGLETSIAPLLRNQHSSELVCIASYELDKLSLNKLIELLSSHGVEKYKLV